MANIFKIISTIFFKTAFEASNKLNYLNLSNLKLSIWKFFLIIIVFPIKINTNILSSLTCNLLTKRDDSNTHLTKLKKNEVNG